MYLIPVNKTGIFFREKLNLMKLKKNSFCGQNFLSLLFQLFLMESVPILF